MNLSSFDVKAGDRLRVCCKMGVRRVSVVDELGTRVEPLARAGERHTRDGQN